MRYAPFLWCMLILAFITTINALLPISLDIPNANDIAIPPDGDYTQLASHFIDAYEALVSQQIGLSRLDRLTSRDYNNPLFDYDNADGTMRPLQASSCSQYTPENSICKNVITDRITYYNLLGPSQEATEATLSAMFMLLSLADPRTGCDVAMFSYFCHLAYPPCGLSNDGQVPVLPCQTFKSDLLAKMCPIPYAAGIFESTSFPFAPDGDCNQNASSLPSGNDPLRPVHPPYHCNEPLVTIDPYTYEYKSIMNGPCSTPCPAIIFTKKDMKDLNNFHQGWWHISQLLDLILVVSYTIFPKVRARRLILIFIWSISIQAWLTYIPWIVWMWSGNPGQTTACAGPAAERAIDGWGGLCVLQGIFGYFAMLVSLLAIMCLAINLVLKVVFEFQIPRHSEREKLQHRIQYGVIFLLPLIGICIILGFKQIAGDNSGAPWCTVAIPRDQTGPALRDWLQLFPAAIFVGIAALSLIAIVVKLGYLKFISRTYDKRAMTVTQIRILVLVCVMCTIYISIFSFRLTVMRITPRMGEELGVLIMCLLTNPGGQDVCGSKPEHGISMSWRYLIGWCGVSTGLTAFLTQGTSLDIYIGWAALLYKWTGLSCLARFKNAHMPGTTTTQAPGHQSSVGSFAAEPNSPGSPAPSEQSTTNKKKQNDIFKRTRFHSTHPTVAHSHNGSYAAPTAVEMGTPSIAPLPYPRNTHGGSFADPACELDISPDLTPLGGTPASLSPLATPQNPSSNPTSPVFED